MEIVKKNLLSIIFGVVALIALIALAYPVSGMYADTQKVLDARKTDSEALTRLKNNKRFWPVIPKEGGTQEQLTRFPNEVIFQEGKRIKEVVARQAEKIKLDTRDKNVHKPLLPGVLPSPATDGRFQFQKAYIIMMDQTFPKELGFNQPADSPELLKSKKPPLLPPTDDDVQAAAKKLYETKYVKNLISVGGTMVNQATVDNEWKAECAKLQGEMRQERAEHCRIWLDKDALAVSRTVPNRPEGPREDEIWWAQNMLWVQEDVISAINDINKNSKNVLDAPIKELIHLDVNDDDKQYVFPQNANGGLGSPAAATPAGAEIPRVYTRSPTGRVSNSLYDVIEFKLVINVDANQIPDILAKLQKGRLITITQVDGHSVDVAELADDGFLYGPAPIAKLNITGEELFLRDWTVPLMPDGIKKSMGIQTPAQTPNGR